MIEIIYCGGGNPRFAQIAIEAGFRYGAQLPNTIYGELYFADQNWKAPNRDVYMAALARHRPHMASVIDWEKDKQLPDVLNWAEDAARFVDVVMIIPKVFGGIARLPNRIGGKTIRLGYSVPTRHGGTMTPAWEFAGRPVHLLGGSPQSQMELQHYFDVRSVDGNMAQLMATRFCSFWDGRRSTRRGYWPTIQEFDGQPWGDGSATADAPYEAFSRSCRNIMAAWRAPNSTCS